MASIQPVTLPFALCELTPEAQMLGLELSSHVSVKWMNDCLRMERKAWTFGDILASGIYPALRLEPCGGQSLHLFRSLPGWHPSCVLLKM